MKRIIIIAVSVVALISIYPLVSRFIPYKRAMQQHQFTIDSVATMGPVVWLYDKRSRQAFWFKSYTSFNAHEYDSLKGHSAGINYMKVFIGPFENRIFKMEVDSVLVFDQVVDSI